jgi:hypothetical protein
MKAKRSKRDSRGVLWVACCECMRGGNGDGTNNCSSGWQCKKWNTQGCFTGLLLEKFEIPLEFPNKWEVCKFKFNRKGC